jgi:hypothetical protein
MLEETTPFMNSNGTKQRQSRATKISPIRPFAGSPILAD